MFLSNIKKIFFFLKINKLLTLIQILNNIKKKKISKQRIFSQILLKKKIHNYKKKNFKQNLIDYILKINLTKTNTLVTLTNVLGSKVLSISSGSVGLTKRQKKQQPIALFKILKFLLVKSKVFNLKKKIVSLQFTNTKSNKVLKVLKKLKYILFINSIKSYYFHPHNGCRPKKLKRFKRRTKKNKFF